MIFRDLRKALKEYGYDISEKKRRLTPEFNLLEIVSPTELQISKLIAAFLNPEGNHAQGNEFLKSFLKLFFPKYRYLSKSKMISVTTEYGQNVKGQIDIIIDFDNSLGIVIENKPFAGDQDRQIMRYVEYLKKTYGENNFLMIYLSATGLPPTERSITKQQMKELGDNFRILSYADIKDWILACNNLVIKNGAGRLSKLLEEIAEYINLVFLNTNKLKISMLNEALEENILDAFEVNKLWNENEKDLKKLWNNKINDLMNKKLPKMVFEELMKRKVIDENWMYIQGDFDIRKRSARGFKIKKKKWKMFQYAILRSRNIHPEGTCDIFPSIMTKTNPDKINFSNDNYLIDYSRATNTEIQKEFWYSPYIIWWTIFPNVNFKLWDYEQWSEIKPDGITVNYLSDFFEKLIKASEEDIDIVEKENL